MAIADGHGFPLAVHVASASPHETKLVEPTLDQRFLAEAPKRMIGDRAYDSDPLDQRIYHRYGVERLFAWLHNFRRTVIRWEYYPENFLGMVQLACAIILLRYL